MKEIYFDLETTGTSEGCEYCDKSNGILQLSGIVVMAGEEKERFDFKMKPFPDQIIEDGALEVNGYTRTEIDGFDDPFACYVRFTRMLNKYVDRFDKSDKFHLIGYNSKFDDDFLREWFKRCNDKYYGAYFFWPAIDVANMAAVKYRKVRSSFLNFKLLTVAKTLKIDVSEEKAHDAMYDVEVTKAVYDKCIGC